MNLLTVSVLALVAYTAASCLWLVCSLDRKNKPNRWYDHILCWPVLAICIVIGWLERGK